MITKPRKIKSAIVFGGAGLVGYQVTRQLAEYISPDKIVICALTQDEVEPAAAKLKKEFPHINKIYSEWGNLFVRESLAHKKRAEMIANDEYLATIFEDIFGNITDEANNVSNQNLMSKIILKHKPDVVIDCINSATGISYQDVKTCSQMVKLFRDKLGALIHHKNSNEHNKVTSFDTNNKWQREIKELLSTDLNGFDNTDNLKMLDLLLISQTMPQLIRHIILLYKALVAVNALMYIKVGTVGTGGMGINIPYTHSEDKPSFTVMAKTAVAFAQTGLLFLLSRAPNSPIVKEIKPGAMIGYRKIDFRSIFNSKRLVKNWKSKKETLSNFLRLQDNIANYSNSGELKLVGIDTGENGFYTRGEFEVITGTSSMEFITPEEVARNVIIELVGSNSGHDVINALSGSIIPPSYLAGTIRQDCIHKMSALEKETGTPSIASGELGPPQVTKLLYEAYLLEQNFSSLKVIIQNKMSAEKLAKKIEEYILNHRELQRTITSLGLPILLMDGKTILRGPKINIPESKILNEVKIKSKKDIDTWAKLGWVDLRANNMKIWQGRAKKILDTRPNVFAEGSACYGYKFYTENTFKSSIVGWILANEFGGYRIK